MLRHVGAALGRLVLPVECAGCGAWDVALCPACRGALSGVVGRCEEGAPRLDRLDGVPPMPVWAAWAYAGPARGVVPAWKDRGRRDLTPVASRAVGRAARAAAPALVAALRGQVLGIVPVPTTPGARRRRGGDLVAGLAEAVRGELCAAGARAQVVPALSRSGRVRDQVGLGARARGVNSAGSWHVRPGPAPGARGPLLVVDDVLTTGATLAGCERALSGSGGLVLGAVVLAAASPPGRDLVPFLTRAVPG